MGKPLPKAGVFAHGQAESVAHTVASRLRGRGGARRFEGHGECFIEMGGGQAGFARGNFYAEPTPRVHMHRPGAHWHAAKVAFERNWWRTWF
jgi:sulfide:quinone oxidoreductase